MHCHVWHVKDFSQNFLFLCIHLHTHILRLNTDNLVQKKISLHVHYDAEKLKNIFCEATEKQIPEGLSIQISAFLSTAKT